MPPVVAGIAVAVASYAGATVAVGTAVTAAIGISVGTTMAGVIGGALIGAAVGGLTAAVMGGDIGQGVLYGAIGGAVIGGIGGYFQGAASTSQGGSGMGASVNTVGRTEGIVDLTKGIGEAGTQAGTQASKGMTGLLIEYGLEPALTIGGSALMGADEADMAAETRAHEAAEREKDRQLQKDLVELNSQYSSGSGGASDGVAIARIQQETELKKLAENRRQYDVQRQDAIQARRRASGSLDGMRAVRGRYKLDDDGTRSFEEVSAEEQESLYPSQQTQEVDSMLTEGTPAAEEEAYA
jgi:hypothetical protein